MSRLADEDDERAEGISPLPDVFPLFPSLSLSDASSRQSSLCVVITLLLHTRNRVWVVLPSGQQPAAGAGQPALRSAPGLPRVVKQRHRGTGHKRAHDVLAD